MKAKNTLFALILMLFFCGTYASAQTVDIEIHIKGIHEAKGMVLLALGNLDEPEKLFTGMKGVTETGELVYSLQGVPDGWETTLNVFQDLDGDAKLYVDANGMPGEPCAAQKVTIKADHPVVEIFLMHF